MNTLENAVVNATFFKAVANPAAPDPAASAEFINDIRKLIDDYERDPSKYLAVMLSMARVEEKEIDGEKDFGVQTGFYVIGTDPCVMATHICTRESLKQRIHGNDDNQQVQ